ncbi:TerC family protein [Hwanghaeella sp.]|uniref:TerC family protein n=1 Tax=Hwanghaeella sp. TaxID=2605943 RepID=UPI003CCBCC12
MENLFVLLASPEVWIALVTLIVMEVVLGIDNLIFISVLTNKLPPEHRRSARRLGIGMALVLRLLLLGSVAFIVSLTEPVLHVFGEALSWRDIILIAGGLFLVWKATKEIHEAVDPHGIGEDGAGMSPAGAAATGMAGIMVQIVLLDLVFSVDSIITAVGMTDHVPVMMVAVVVAVLAMLLAAEPLARFIERNPTIVMLALGFLLLIGTTLIADGFGVHVPKGYIYAAMAFSAFVEMLNTLVRRSRRRARPVTDDFYQRRSSRWMEEDPDSR